MLPPSSALAGCFRSASRQRLRLPRAHAVLAAFLLVLGFRSGIHASAQAIASLSPDPLAEVRSLLAAGQLPVVENHLRALIAAAPNDPEPRFLLGYTLFKRQRAVDSLAAFTEAARLRSPTADELVTVASDYVLLKDFADARRWLDLATRTSPSNVAAWYLLGRADFSLDRAEEAKQAFLTCLRLQPNHVKARYNLGLVYERLRQPEIAAETYRQAIAMEASVPHQDSQPFLNLGVLLLGQEKPHDALDPLKTAVHLAPQNPLAHQQLALCLEKLGLFDQAATEMALCAKLAPDAQGPPFFLGRLYHRLGREAEAKEQFARASTLAGTRSAGDVPNLEPANSP